MKIPEKNIYFFFIDYVKANTINWKIFQEMVTLPTSWETCMQVKKQQLELDMEQQIGSKLGKECAKAVFITLLI